MSWSNQGRADENKMARWAKMYVSRAIILARGRLFQSTGENMCPTGDYFGPRAIILARGQKYVSHGRLFWPAGDYFGPRAKDDKAYSLARVSSSTAVYEVRLTTA